MINTHEDESGEESGKRPKVWYCPYKFQAYGEEEIKAVEECLRDGWLAPGPRTAVFETLVSTFCGKKHGVMVNSGSAGNTLALLIAGVKEGDEVITPACTFSTVLAPLVQMRAVPVFCDVQLDTFVPSVEQVLACITPKTKCIYLPDLAGTYRTAHCLSDLAMSGILVWIMTPLCVMRTALQTRQIALTYM